MAKQPSRTIIYTAVGAVAVYAIFLYTQPPTSTTATPRVAVTSADTTQSSGTDDNMTPADLAAHFARYTGGKRDPFVPGVINISAQTQVSTPFGAPGKRGGWTLTGINEINGVTSAVLENSGTGDSVFLQQGDEWDGLKVVSIDDQDVVFENALGQKSTLGFAQPADPNTPGGAGSSSTIPSINSITQVPALPPMPTITRPTAQVTSPAPTVGRNESLRIQ
jgi:hypothetical protein